MPTGYTHSLIQEKEITFSQFAMNCAKAFGACIDLRDEPEKEIPDEFPLSTYHFEGLEKAQKDLENFKQMIPCDFEGIAENNFQKAIIDYEKEVEKNNETFRRYNTMLKSVKNWTPPTSEHFGLKNFMIQQIEDSIKWDIHEPQKPIVKTPEDTRQEMLDSILWDIEYHTKEKEKEIERTNSKNKWIKDLRESFKNQ